MSTEDKTVVLFDGVCNLCNSLVIFLIKRDRKKALMFTALQSKVGQSILKSNQLKTDNFDSFVLYKNGKIYQKSGAGIRVLGSLGGFWTLMYIFLTVPSPIRNWVYSLIANNRYKWWGQKDACMIPTPELKSRFL